MVFSAHRASKRVQVGETGSETRALFLPYFLWVLMIAAIRAMGITSSLGTLSLSPAFPHTPFETWLLGPAHMLFPGYPLVGEPVVLSLVPFTTAWIVAASFFSSFCLLFLIYLFAIIFLSRRVSYRFIFFSTCVLGLVFLILPALGSQDVFSYIIYARIGIIYHLNPLTTVPAAIHLLDPIRPLIYWRSQPSAYGPTWVAITSLLQMLSSLFPPAPLMNMVLLLRGWGLIMTLGSLHLLWSMTGRQQRISGRPTQRTRLIAALAFAWNPFVLFEGVMNAHIDITIVFFVLLTLWFLQRFESHKWIMVVLASLTLALTVCLKVNVVIFFPGLLLFLWAQRGQRVLPRLQYIVVAVVCFTAALILLYAPFWQQGAVLTVFHINPSLTRDVNSPYDFFLHIYLGIQGQSLIRPSNDVGAPQEILMHQISTVLFLIVYIAICVWYLLLPERIKSLAGLIGWMALVWFIYCLLGSAWYMPWYMLTYFGLIALLIGMSTEEQQAFRRLHLPTAMYALSFGMFIMYCFAAYAPSVTFILPYLSVGALRELLNWLVLLAAIRWPRFASEQQRLARRTSRFSAAGKALMAIK